MQKSNDITEFTSSKLYGTEYKNETFFDDSEFVKDLLPDIKIKQIDLYKANGYICGIQIYYLNGQKVSNGLYVDADVEKETDDGLLSNMIGQKVKKKSLEIDDDDEIEEIVIHSGDIIDGIGFITKKENSLFVGGNGGNHKSLKFKGLKFVGISGSLAKYDQGNYWRTIHSLKLYFTGEGKIEESNSTRDNYFKSKETSSSESSRKNSLFSGSDSGSY